MAVIATARALHINNAPTTLSVFESGSHRDIMLGLLW
jgi:hypothetical protein